MSGKSPIDAKVDELVGVVSGLQKKATERADESRKDKAAKEENDAELARAVEGQAKLRASLRERDRALRETKAMVTRAESGNKERDADLGRMGLEGRAKDAQIHRLTNDGAAKDAQIRRLTDDGAAKDVELNTLRRDIAGKDTHIVGLRTEVRFQEERYEGCSVCITDYVAELMFLDCHHSLCVNCLRNLRLLGPVRCPKCREAIVAPVRRTWVAR